jgi:hypothetical protein
MPFFGTGSDIPFLKRINVYLESVENAKMDHDISDERVNHIAFDRKENFFQIKVLKLWSSQNTYGK